MHLSSKFSKISSASNPVRYLNSLDVRTSELRKIKSALRVKRWMKPFKIALLSALFISGVVNAATEKQNSSFIFLAIIAGAVGGFIQDVLQNKGIIKLPKKVNDEIYLGSFVGILLGAISGASILVSNPQGSATSVALVAFLAGAGVKGLGEAVTSKKPGGGGKR